MFKRNHILASVVAASMVVGVSAANAQETVTATASVTVQNAFNFTKVADINFGTLRVTHIDGSDGDTDIATVAELVLNADGTASDVTQGTDTAVDGTSQISVIAEGTPAEFAIDSAAPNTRMSLTLPSGAQNLASPLDTATPIFEATFTNDDVVVVNSDGSEVAFNGINLVTDALGAVGFKLGGTLAPVSTEVGNIDDGDYTGDFDVTVDY